ncbi:MAG: hypothetical protein GY940_46670, partial [bacterium]|nr:hypothetical protein [bacterium]
TSSGLNYFENNEIHSFTTADGRSDNNISNIYQDSRGNLWFITKNNSVNRLTDGKITHYSFYKEKPNAHHLLFNFFEDREKRLWLGTFDTLSRFNYKTDSFAPLLVHHAVNINNIFQDSAGNLWVSSFTKGICLVDIPGTVEKGIPTLIPFPKLAHLRLKTVLFDREGNLWLGTHIHGLHRMPVSHFNNFSVSHGLPVESLLSLPRD